MTDQYYTPNELAKLLKLAPSKVRQVFANRPGVIVIEEHCIGRHADAPETGATMDPITHARQEQMRCAGEVMNPDQPDQRGAALGLFDWFAEEFLLTYDQQ